MLTKVSTPHQLFRVSRYLFAKEKPTRPKVQTVGFANKHIENIKTLSHKISVPIEYTDGKCLIYQSRPSVLRTLKDYWFHLTAMSSFSYCLFMQINFTVYPIIKHCYIAGLAITAALIAQKFLKNQAIVKEIYLLEGGKATQIVYQNSLKRKLFREPLDEIFYNSIFAPPKISEEENLNPTEFSFPEDTSKITQNMMFSYWKKRFSNDQNIIIIPTNYNYMNAQALVNIMKGKIIIS